MVTFVESAKIIQLGNFWMLRTSDGQQRQFKASMLLDPNMPLEVGMDVLLTLEDDRITAIWYPSTEDNGDESESDGSDSFERTEGAELVNIRTVLTNIAKKILTKKVLIAVGTGAMTELVRRKTGKPNIQNRLTQKSQKELLGEFTDLWGKVVLELTKTANIQKGDTMVDVINRAFSSKRINEQEKATLHRIRKLRNAIQHPSNESEHEDAKRQVDSDVISSLKTILVHLEHR